MMLLLLLFFVIFVDEIINRINKNNNLFTAVLVQIDFSVLRDDQLSRLENCVHVMYGVGVVERRETFFTFFF